MSQATNLAAASKSPLWMIEWDGDTHLSLDSTTGWVASADATGFATTTTCKEGAAGLTWDKTGTGSVNGFITASALTAFDMSDSAYRALWCYLPNLTNLDNVFVTIGQDLSNRWVWEFEVAGLVAGWNFLRLDIITQGANITFSTFGAPVVAGCVNMRIGVATLAAGNTFSGFIVDWVTKHPYRYSTGTMTSPAATTKAGWLQVPNIQPNMENVQEGSLNVGSALVEIVDDGAATLITDLDRFAFVGRTATIWQGFRGEAEDPNVGTNWKQIYRGVTFQPTHLGKAWSFQISSLLEKLRRPIMQDATQASSVTLSGTIVTCWLKLALSTGNGTNNTTYDTLTAVRGAGIPQDLIDVSSITTLETDWLGSDSASFSFKAPEADFLAWSFKEFFLAYGIVPVVKADGRLSIQVVRPPYGDDSTRTLSESNIITPMPQYTEDLSSIFNQVTIYYGYDIATDTYLDPVRQGDTTSQGRYGVRDLAIYSKGITDSATATRVAKRILARLGNGAPPITLDLFMSQQQIELGELVRVDHDAVPDTSAGTYTMASKLAEVVRRGFNPQTGRTAVTVALTSYQAGNYRRIGPAAMTGPYDSNSASQNARYMSISDSSNYLGAANDPTHVIGPG